MKLKLTSEIFTSLLQAPKPTVKKTMPSSAARSAEIERGAITAFAHWGHLRCAELAEILWGDVKYRDQLCQRLVKRMVVKGLLMTRLNAVGTRSFVLTRPGAAYAEGMGIDARHGLDLASVSGATFIHRCIATRYGIERCRSKSRAFGEHAMASTISPLSREFLRASLGKLPDLIILDRNALEWIEVESSAKPKAEIQRCLSLARYCGGLFPNSDVKLSRVIFVCDERLNHESRIKKAARELWSNVSQAERNRLASYIWLVKVQLGPCSKWLSCSEPVQICL